MLYSCQDNYEDFINNLFDKSKTNDDIQEELLKIVKCLYRYVPYDENNASALKDNNLWFSFSSIFNDPLDSAAIINLADNIFRGRFSSEDEFSCFLNKWYTEIDNKINIEKNNFDKSSNSYDKQLFKNREEQYTNEKKIIEKVIKDKDYNIDKFVKDYYKKLGEIKLKTYEFDNAISCFSEVNNSVSMWSYYADGHKGICVKYDVRELFEKFKKKIIPVIYDETVQLKKIMSIDKKSCTLFTSTEKEKYLRYCHKNMAWYLEREWRILIDKDYISKNHKKLEEASIVNGCLCEGVIPKTIYLGCRMDRTNKDEIKTAYKDNIEVLDMNIDDLNNYIPPIIYSNKKYNNI
ncbi:DUF2971 domain-containing protein [Pectinatus frisingensis]|uniref:DUF2971 domain-containing protein n=1 Tax=Pectinatus frisingensis TaxID=865 RepID=UPI003D8032A1